MFALLQAACGGGGGGSSAGGHTLVPANAAIVGSVPGTLIEAFGDNGSYYVVQSNDNGTARHPFELDVLSGLGIRLVMITGEGTPDEVVIPIGFRDSAGNIRTRLVLGAGDVIDLGHVPLPMGMNAAAMDDLDGDGVLDSPMVLDDVGAQNPLSQSDADEDGIDDWNDDDHGGYHYNESTQDPQDEDDDGIPNSYDSDYLAGEGDSDGDGLPDNVDANPHNDEEHDNDGLHDDCDSDGYLDDDDDHDGFHDDDDDRDGFHDDDLDHDGHHDDEEGDDTGTCPIPSTTTTTTSSTTSTAPTTTTTSTTTPATTTTTTLPPLPGLAVYDNNGCGGCHDAGGHDSDGSSFGDIAGTGSKLLGCASGGFGDISCVSGAMGSVPDLTVQEFNDLAAFLDSL
jgi:hypothetical protein